MKILLLSRILLTILFGLILIQSCQEKEQPAMASILTEPATEIGGSTVKVPVTFSVLGSFQINQKGICWGINPQPNISENKTTEGSEPGSYNSTLTGLNEATKYYARAYFMDNTGAVTYGNEISFTTIKELTLTITTKEVTDVSTSTAKSGGVVTSSATGSITVKGICWSKVQNPTVADSKATNGTLSETFIIPLTDLSPGTTYYVRAFATTNTGKTTYGNEVSFTTLSPLEVRLNTNIVSNITSTTASSGGTVVTTGSGTITEKGICWSTVQNPTINNNKTSDGTGTTDFSSSLTGLTANTRYYIRAYATTNTGATFYGNEITFTTLSLLEVRLTTTNASNITNNRATSGGTLTVTGFGNIVAKGVCWSTVQNPTLSNSKSNDGAGTGSFASAIIGLNSSTTYYARAYATTDAGNTFYGNEISFTTVSPLQVSVLTNNVTNVTANAAFSGGTITTNGSGTIIAKGLCWNTSQNPTTNDNKTLNGTGIASFTGSLTGLNSQTTYYVRAYATTDAGTTFYGNQVAFTTPELITLSLTTTNPSNVTNNSAVSGGTITGLGTVASRGVCLSTSPMPDITDNRTTNGMGAGSFASSLTGLVGGQTYYIRAYATTNGGVTLYGNQVSFTTLNLVVVSTTSPTNIGVHTATAGGGITTNDLTKIISSGLCWSTSPSPTINNSVAIIISSTGIYSSVISGLTANTTYYLRAYATTNTGTTYYGNQISFKTLPEIAITTTTPYSVSYYSAYSGGTIVNYGTSSISATGICYSTTPNPSLTNGSFISASGSLNFTSWIRSLSRSTTYYVRAYATSNGITTYGNQVSFTTW